jgi:hypothetical protein
MILKSADRNRIDPHTVPTTALQDDDTVDSAIAKDEISTPWDCPLKILVRRFEWFSKEELLEQGKLNMFELKSRM